MQIVSMTSQGQITIPADIRRKYDFGANSKVIVREKDNKVIVEPVPDLLDLAGSLNKYAIKGKSPEEIREMERKAIAEGYVERYQSADFSSKIMEIKPSADLQ